MSVVLSPIRDVEFAASAPRAQTHAEVSHWAHWPLVGLLILTPLGFGATSVRGSLIFVAGAWLAFLAWIAGALRQRQLELQSLPVLGPAVLLLLYTAAHWILPLSATPLATQLEWLRWVGVVTVALVAGEAVRNSVHLRQVCVALAIAGVVVSVFAIAQYLTSNGKIYWLVEPTQGGWMFGPYVNRNHFAGLIEMWIPLAVGLALMPHNTFTRRWLWCLAALVMGTAVALSGSRGGVLAIGVEVLLIVFVAAWFRGGKRPVIALAVSVVLVAGAVALLGRGEIFERYKQSLQMPKLQQEEAAAHRIEAWRGALAIFRQHPITGTGLDTFVTHFPAVRTFATDKVWTHAHNDFLQFLAETGLIGAAFAAWILVAGGREAWRNIRRASGTATGALLVGLACACVGFMVHGWLDFNFHVPANAANFAAIGAILTRRGWDED